MFVRHYLAAVMALAGAGLSVPVMAQMDHSMHGSSSQAVPSANQAPSMMAQGQVKKFDKTKGTVTLAHGAMNGMPAMTMVYKVKDSSWFGKLQAGQKIRFATDAADGGMTVTKMEWAK